ncbi:MAG: DUF2203 domain-containing protein [Planctomycetes bacterium]|nr:DUF2203 domain-containing protein [Planctomycetota bacterium]
MNATRRPKKQKKNYTLEEANAMLPLLRVILRDVTTLAGEQRDCYERLIRLKKTDGLDRAHKEEVEQVAAAFEAGQEKMREYEAELEKLHVELKDYYTGLIDFRHLKEGKEVYLCWRLGEPEVAHWHDLNAGFGGRQKLDAACCGAGS